MKRTLLILRHAKSDRDDGNASGDFERPLAKRGTKDALRMGRWLQERGLIPHRVLSSPAVRARQTVETVMEILGLPATMIHFDKQLYLAGRDTLCELVAGCPPMAKVLLLVGHNPGLEELLEYLSAVPPSRNAAGKLLTAGALAQMTLPRTWKKLQPQGATLVELVRPRELDG